LEGKFSKECEINERLSKELTLLKETNAPALALSNDDYLDHIEELTHKLSVVEHKLKSLRETKLCETCTKLMNALGMSDTTNDAVVAGEISRLKLQLQTALSERGVLEMRISQMADDLQRVELERTEAVKEKADAGVRYDKMAAERDRLIKERTLAQKQLRDTELKLKGFNDKFDETKKTHTLQMEELQRCTMQLQLEADSLMKAQQALMPYKQQVEALTEQLKSATSERDSLLHQLNQLKLSMSSSSSLTAPDTSEPSVKAKLDELQARHSEVLRRVEAEKSAIESVNQSLQRDNEQLRDELSILKHHHPAPTANRLPPVQTANDQCVQQLQQQIVHLENALSESRMNANIINNGMASQTVVTKLQVEKDSAEAQVEFLNSVIVDLQRKNEMLEAKLQIMESSGMLMTDSVTDSLIINGSVSRLMAPRLFCDICDVFDLHDTDDCPQQGTSSSPPASHHHGCRSDQRPYCTVCEVFGHSAEQCSHSTIF
jgi:CAP-Gly domain-containing linker protein 1